MTEKTVLTGPEPSIVISQVHGNLEVKGWDKDEVELMFSSDTLELEEGETGLRLACHGNLDVRVPLRASVHVAMVHGQARFKLLENSLALGQVHGSLTLREVAGGSMEKLHGNLTARNLSGDLHAGRVLGNVQLRGIQGDCKLEEVDGNLDLDGLVGNLKAAVEGNARLGLSDLLGDLYEIETEGNLHINLPEDADMHLYLSSGGQSIKLKLPGNTRAIQQKSYELTLGDGRATLRASAAGNMFISSQTSEGGSSDSEADFEAEMNRLTDDIGRQIEAQIAAQMEAMSRQLNEQMARLSADLSRSGLADAQVQRVVEQARRSSERAQERAQEKMRRAQEKMQQKAERMERRNQAWARHSTPPVPPIPPIPPVPPVGRRGRSWNFEWTPASQATQPPEQVSEEERLMILRMLEQKKISLAEAEQLLAALDDREG